jgi:hypothetical protein
VVSLEEFADRLGGAADGVGFPGEESVSDLCVKARTLGLD